jgi:flap endonuclease-1
MGIKNLKVILNQKCQHAINTRKLDSYRGMVLGIDISIFLYKYLYNNSDHIEGLTRLILRLLKNQITPVFIFDGKPPKEKNEVLQDRKEKKDFMNIKKGIIDTVIKLEKLNYDDFREKLLNHIQNTNSSYIIDDYEIKDFFEKSKDELEKDSEKINKKIIYVTQYHIDNAKKLFDLFGIKYIHAPCEAESLLAILCKNNIVDGCISEDTDILANGGHLFLRNFNADKNTVEEYCLDGILASLEISYEKFIDMCILCGCDYTSKIMGMGPITAYKLINKYGSIEEIIKNNEKFNIPENFDYVKARDLFKNPISEEIYKNVLKDTKMIKPQIKELCYFLVNTKLKEKYFKEIEKNLMSYYLNIDIINQIDNNTNNKQSSKKITDFFS